MSRYLWPACVLMIAAPFASGAQFLKDINAVEFWDESESSSFGEGATVAGGTLFSISDRQRGAELWITDGTTAGTRLVRDINPGPQSSNISRMTLVAGVAMFFADDGANGEELWRSDGTAAGTQLVANIGAGATPYHPLFLNEYGPFATIGAVIYFRAVDAAGEELWRSDGTASGTYRVADIVAGAGGSAIRNFRIAGSRLYFLATDSAGEELWTSDGTTAGTVRVADIGTGATGGDIGDMAVAGDRLYFVATSLAHGREIWRTTAVGTTAEVVDVNTLAEPTDASRTRSSAPAGLFVLGDAVMFGAQRMTGTPMAPVTEYGLYRVGATGAPQLLLARPNGAYPQDVIVAGNNALFRFDFLDLYVTNGTAAGTVPLGLSNLYVEFGATVMQQGGVAYFFAQQNPGTGNMGYDLWRTDGTVAGTRQFANIDTSHPEQDLVWFNGRVYFTHNYFVSPVSHHEVWASDGTVNGTIAITGPDTTNLSGLLVGAGRLYFTAMGADYSFDPWVSDGSVAGTRRLLDLGRSSATRDSGVQMLGALGSTVFFNADDGVHGTELWASDGTGAGTRLVRDIAPGPDSGPATGIVAMNGFALFSADDGAHGQELWRTDGTENGTFMVKDIQPGTGTSHVGLSRYHGLRLGAHVYFMADDGVNGNEVWRTDGTESGTTRLSNFAPGDVDFAYLLPHLVNSRLFVIGQRNGSRVMFSVLASNGSHLELVTDAAPDSVDTAAVFQNRLCWLGYDNNFDSEIRCTDGTAGSIEIITDFTARGLNAIGAVFAVNGRLLVDVYADPSAGGGLYASDGTIASLQKISDLRFGSHGVYLSGNTRYVANVSVLANSPDLMITDGTPAGTRLFLPPGVPPQVQPIPNYAIFGVFEDQLVFSVRHPLTGDAVWKSDGTASGTRFVADVNPAREDQGPAPDAYFQNGSRLYFSANRTGLGSELWSLTAVNPNASDDIADTSFNTAVNIDVLANDGVFSGSLSGASVEIVAAPASGSTSINPVTGAITYTPDAGFSGLDTFTYRVGDGLGNASNIAYVQVITRAQISGAAPGTAPVPPSPPPPTTPPPPPAAPANPPSSGGGGGAFGIEVLWLALLLPFTRRRRASSAR